MFNWTATNEIVNIWTEVSNILNTAIDMVPEDVKLFEGSAIIAETAKMTFASIDATTYAIDLYNGSQGRGTSAQTFIQSALKNAAAKADFRATLFPIPTR